jgi:hypothetical protein
MPTVAWAHEPFECCQPRLSKTHRARNTLSSMSGSYVRLSASVAKTVICPLGKKNIGAVDRHFRLVLGSIKSMYLSLL